MCIITSVYKKKFLSRYDKDGITPFFTASDFAGLKCERGFFTNGIGIKVAYFIYNYDNYDKDRPVVFCHGLGPGHTAYMREIEYLCKNGLRVLAFDATGTGESGGDGTISINRGTRDIIELIDHLQLKGRLAIVGHSLGGYTALNVLRLMPSIKKGVIMSAFLSVKTAFTHFTKSKLFGSVIDNYEKRRCPDISGDNLEFLRSTDDKLMFIASVDDPMVDFTAGTGAARALGRDNFTFIIENDKKHNPNYTVEAVKYMRGAFTEYARLVKEKTLVTFEQKKAFFADKSLYEMTEQDDRVMGAVVGFIKE